MRRIGIFCFYDKSGIVDDYIIYFLDSIRPFLKELLIVCNGKISDSERLKFQKYACDVLERENDGFDIWAYKAGIEYLGWDFIQKHDELLMFNSTNFGPLYPLEEVFSKMDSQSDLDFWGITKYMGHRESTSAIIAGILPEHIQTYWMIFRKKVLEDHNFRNYWKFLHRISSYDEAVNLHEVVFTKYLEKLGYKWDTYVEMNDLETTIENPLVFYSFELVKSRRCPFVKRKTFLKSYSEVLTCGIGNDARDTFEHIKFYTNYDVGLIWSNLLRTCHMVDINKNLHLNHVLSEDNLLDAKQETFYKVGLVFHIYFEDLILACVSKIKTMPEGTDILITTDTEGKVQKINIYIEKLELSNYQIQVKIVPNRGRDVSAFLIAARSFILDHEIICFAHDKKTGDIKPGLIGEGFLNKCFESIFKNETYVRNILVLFNKDPRLGILCPLPPNHAVYFGVLGGSWSTNYAQVKKLATKLQLRIPIDKEKEPIAAMGSMFWFRSKALRPLFELNLEYEDFPCEPLPVDGSISHAIERIHSYVAQNEGFYTARVIPTKLAEIELTNLISEIEYINKKMFKIFKFRSLDELGASIEKMIRWNEKKQKVTFRYWRKEVKKFFEN